MRSGARRSDRYGMMHDAISNCIEDLTKAIQTDPSRFQ